MFPIRSLSSKVSVLASLNYCFGQLHSGSHINCGPGPVNHLHLLLKSNRVPSSAGFRGRVQSFLRLVWVLSKISAAL